MSCCSSMNSHQNTLTLKEKTSNGTSPETNNKSQQPKSKNSVQGVNCKSVADEVVRDGKGVSNPAFVVSCTESELSSSGLKSEELVSAISSSVSDNIDCVSFRKGNAVEHPNSFVSVEPCDASNYNAETMQSTTALVQLKKELGLWNGIGIIIGIMIGSGIFVSPGTVLKYSGSIGMSLIVWILTGFMTMVGAICFAELGTMIPTSGGAYAYTFEAFGSIPAFLSMWIQILLQRPAGRAINALTFATYLLQPIRPNCTQPPYMAVRLIAAALLCIVTYINCLGVKLGTMVQNIFSVMKILALILIITIGVVHLLKGNVGNFQNPWQGTVTDPSIIATAFYSTSFAYSGWNSLNTLTEELVDPYRNLPRAIAVSLITVIIIYALTNVAYFAVLTPSEILSSSAVAVTFGSRSLGIIGWIISICVACSTFGNTNGNFIVQSRLMYVGARQGHLPRFMALIQVNNYTPITAVVSVVIMPLLLLMAPDIGTLLAYTSFSRNLTDLMCVLALLWLRYTEPQRNRPIKVWIGFPILYLVLSIFVVVFPVVQKPVEIAVALGLFLAGLLIYYITIHIEVQVIKQVMEKLTYICQMVFLCVEEEKTD